MGDMDTAWVFVIGFTSGALAWATVGEWCIRSLARHLAHR